MKEEQNFRIKFVDALSINKFELTTCCGVDIKVGNGWLCEAITTGAGDMLDESMIEAADSALEAFVVNMVC